MIHRLEEQICAFRVACITQHESTLDRYLLIAPEVKRLVDEFEDNHDANRTKEKIYHQLIGSVASRLQQEAAKLMCGKSFAPDMELMYIASNMTVTCTAERDIIERDAAFKGYMADKLVNTTAKMSIWDPMKKFCQNHLLICKREHDAS